MGEAVTIPNKNNFCGGNFADWLEVMLTDKCNGWCSWCIERNGYHPTERVSWAKLCSRIAESGKKNIVLLGGEPTLYPYLGRMVRLLGLEHGLNVYITTNGSRLSRDFVSTYLPFLKGVNISIHSYNMVENCEITGIRLERGVLRDAIDELHLQGATVRFNCNLIRGHIDTEEEIRTYIRFAKGLGADGIRFAELKGDPENFVSLYDIFGDKYGINNEPFGLGCNTDVEINGMPVNFRLMCGLQTPLREAPVNPQQVVKKVLYYDGKFYNGWQTKEVKKMTERQVLEILTALVDGKTGIIDTAKRIMLEVHGPASEADAGSKVAGDARKMVDDALGGKAAKGCQY